MALSRTAVCDEPLIPNSQGNGTQDGARNTAVPPNNRGDVAACDFWKWNTTTIFDFQIPDTDVQSYLDWDPARVLTTQEKAKKKNHLAKCLVQCKRFTPLVSFYSPKYKNKQYQHQ